MPGVTDRIDTVIADGSLRRLAHERSATSAPVLIEVTGPSRPADVAVARGGAVDGRRPTVTVMAGAGTGAASARRPTAPSAR